MCVKKTPAEAGQVDLDGRREHTASSAFWWRKVTENTDRQKYFPRILLPEYFGELSFFRFISQASISRLSRLRMRALFLGRFGGAAGFFQRRADLPRVFATQPGDQLLRRITACLGVIAQQF
jgi:hypothetical protein